MNEAFAAGNSWIHKIDPRYKIVFAAFFSAAAALSSKFPALFAGFFFSIFLAFLAKIGPVKLIKRLRVVFGFILFLWIIVPLTFRGEDFYTIFGTVSVSREGVFLCARITVKSISILICLTALTATMPIAAMGHALNKLFIPDKLVFLFLITYRYIYIAEQEYRRLLQAAKIRCFKASNSFHCYKTYAYFIGMLFVRSAERSKRVYQAMLCRGFNGKFRSLLNFEKGKQNTFFAVLMSFIISTLILLEYLFSYTKITEYLLQNIRFF